MYLARIIEQYPIIDNEFIDLLTWLLPGKIESIHDMMTSWLRQGDGGVMNDTHAYCCDRDRDGNAAMLTRAFRTAPAEVVGRLYGMIRDMLVANVTALKPVGMSEIEGNSVKFKEMFGLDEDELALCTFLHVVNTHSNMLCYFKDHLECGGPIGRKYLIAALDLTLARFSTILNGACTRMNMVEINTNWLRLNDDFQELFQNSTRATVHESLFVPLRGNFLPLEAYFIDTDKTRHLVDILSGRPTTSTHVLLYGAPGTGKTCYAHSIARETGLDV